MDLPFAIAKMYYEAIDTLSHQEMLLDMAAGDYPHLKKSGRNKLHKAVSRKANKYTPREHLTVDQIKNQLKRAMNGRS